jgi:hypothetical protein
MLLASLQHVAPSAGNQFSDAAIRIYLHEARLLDKSAVITRAYGAMPLTLHGCVLLKTQTSAEKDFKPAQPCIAAHILCSLACCFASCAVLHHQGAGVHQAQHTLLLHCLGSYSCITSA